MPSETDVLNDALSQIGASPIVAIDDGSVSANHCQRLYPALRDALIRAHHWNWAMTRVELAEDATPPPFEFAFSFALPADCLKIVEFNGVNLDTTLLVQFDQHGAFLYKIEGRKLLTNYGTALIVYLARVTNPDVWDPLFYQVVATWLASKLASAIPKDDRKSSELLNKAVTVLMPLATAVDGQEGSIQPMISDALTWGRR